jgi:hypothetical protein
MCPLFLLVAAIVFGGVGGAAGYGRYRGHNGQRAVRGLNGSAANDPKRTLASLR